MTVYQKIADVWVEVQRPYARRNGVWVPATDVYVKRSGSWVRAYEYDKTPSSPPEISLQIISNRYIKLGIRIPGAADPDVKRVRVLASRKEMPTTQFGVGYLYEEDADWKGESWSDWYFNGANPVKSGANHGADTTDWDYKQYPPNPTDSTNLPGGQWYYFAAWSEDMNGNWSVGTYTKVWMPKEGVKADKVILKEANFQASGAGSAGVNGASYVVGDLVVRESPRSDGFWFHGNKFTASIGEQGAPTVKNAKIRVTRSNDTGQATANVRLFWHGEVSSADLPMNDSLMNNITLLGTINKGETKWFDIPTTYFSHFNTEIKGFGLVYGVQASDYLVVSGLATDMRCGEVNVVWEEAL